MGKRQAMERHTGELTKAGLVAITVSYRLAPAARLPDILQTAEPPCATYVVMHRSLGIDPRRIAAMATARRAHGADAGLSDPPLPQRRVARCRAE